MRTRRPSTRGATLRALAAAVTARPAVDAALRATAEAVAARTAEAGVEARVLRRGAGRYAVEATGPALFARVSGPIDAPPEPAAAGEED